MHEILKYVRRFLIRIDGGSEGATLLKTSMSEKETVLDDLPTVLMPASELEQYSTREGQSIETQSREEKSREQSSEMKMRKDEEEERYG